MRYLIICFLAAIVLVATGCIESHENTRKYIQRTFNVHDIVSEYRIGLSSFFLVCEGDKTRLIIIERFDGFHIHKWELVPRLKCVPDESRDPEKVS